MAGGEWRVASGGSVSYTHLDVYKRQESHGEPGRIQVSRDTYDLLRDAFTFERRGEIAIKGKGLMLSLIHI